MKKQIEKDFRKTKGITLIALIVTIIVLMILAGAGIATLSGNNNILKIAGDAKNKTESAGEIEIIRKSVGETMAYDKNGNISLEIFTSRLNENSGNRNITVENDENGYIVKFEDSERAYTVSLQGTVKSAD